MKRLFSPLAVMMSLFLIVPVHGQAPDLPESHTFYEEIAYMMEKGVVRGYEDGTVRPNQPVTRAQAAVMIARLKGLDTAQQPTAFRDVPKSHFASGAIAASAKAGYLTGYRDKTFKPDAMLSRAHMAVILARVFRLNLGFQNGFKDLPPNTPVYDAVNKILAANITSGYPDNTFRPNGKVTRGQFAAFMARGLEPKFKNKARIPHSYMKDKTKTYTYRMEDGTPAVHKYANVPDKGSLVYGFMWTVQFDGETGEYMELENYSFFGFGWPYSEYDIALAYPVKLGKKFPTYNAGEEQVNTITAVNKTVATRYKTFTNATEVTTRDGVRYYLVEGFSTVKTVDAAGKPVFELISVK